MSDYCQAFFKMVGNPKVLKLIGVWLPVPIRIIGFLADDRCQNRSIIHDHGPTPFYIFPGLGVEEVKDLFYFDPYVTSVRLSFSPRYFGGYYSQKGRKNYLEKWDPLHVTTRKMTSIPLDLKQRAEFQFRWEGFSKIVEMG